MPPKRKVVKKPLQTQKQHQIVNVKVNTVAPKRRASSYRPREPNREPTRSAPIVVSLANNPPASIQYLQPNMKSFSPEVNKPVMKDLNKVEEVKRITDPIEVAPSSLSELKPVPPTSQRDTVRMDIPKGMTINEETLLDIMLHNPQTTKVGLDSRNNPNIYETEKLSESGRTMKQAYKEMLMGQEELLQSKMEMKPQRTRLTEEEKANDPNYELNEATGNYRKITKPKRLGVPPRPRKAPKSLSGYNIID